MTYSIFMAIMTTRGSPASTATGPVSVQSNLRSERFASHLVREGIVDEALHDAFRRGRSADIA